ncbi:hypothetical protein F442_07166 [Phytophthora nicotianae P10297]|uniref:Uncharacterized protein n=1 Tax=Phytophthora nicotianae P10297 TaxID=1317064 RepID=W2ZGW1_PHYNI|nr:hypothetical protein F442_07166 [Phytophthora nicotianae P10297]
MRCIVTKCKSKRCKAAGETCHCRYKILEYQESDGKIVFVQVEPALGTVDFGRSLFMVATPTGYAATNNPLQQYYYTLKLVNGSKRANPNIVHIRPRLMHTSRFKTFQREDRHTNTQ